MSSLTSLDLSGNKIHYLPSSVGDLRSLRVLDLSSAELRELPEKLGQLTQLQEINLSGNRWVGAPLCAGLGAALHSMVAVARRRTTTMHTAAPQAAGPDPARPLPPAPAGWATSPTGCSTCAA
jgi:hypothetical protein